MVEGIDYKFSLSHLPRSIQILPNQLLGLVGQHAGGFPVEHMCLSHDNQYLISSSQDSCHFWPMDQVPTLPNPDSGAEEDDEDEELVTRKRKKRKRKQKHLAAEKLAKHKKSSDFFSDLWHTFLTWLTGLSCHASVPTLERNVQTFTISTNDVVINQTVTQTVLGGRSC